MVIALLAVAGALVGPPVPPSPDPPGAVLEEALFQEAPPGTELHKLDQERGRLMKKYSPKQIGWGWYAYSAGGQLGDVVSTRRFRGLGMVESNPRIRELVDRPVPFTLVKVGIVGIAVPAAGSLVVTHFERRGHRWARPIKYLIPILAGTAGAYATVHNERRLARECARRAR